MYENETAEPGAEQGAGHGQDMAAEFDALAVEAGPDTGPAGAAPDAAADLPTKQVVAFFLSPLFQVMAPNWNVGADEVEALAEVYAPVIDKYAPGGLGIEGAALLVTVAILGPRLMTPRKAPPAPPAPDQGAPFPEFAPAPLA